MRLTLATALVVLLTGCVAVPESRQGPALDGARLNAIANDTNDTGERGCIHSTMLTTSGLFFMRLGEATDKQVEISLLRKVDSKVITRQRRAEVRIWARTHDQAIVGTHHLRWCLKRTGHIAVSDHQIAHCLRTLEPYVLAVSSRAAKLSRLHAMVRVKTRYPGQFTVPALEQLTQGVYARKDFEEEDVPVLARAFGACLRDTAADLD